jgi:hypothetical protein
MWSMSGRPCNPGNDLKGLWRIFLRDIPMPQCAAPPDPQAAEDSRAAASDPAPVKPAPNTTHER